MSTIQDVSPEQLAQLIYHYRAALADDSKPDTDDGRYWEHASHEDRKVMVAAARLTLLELSTTPEPSRLNRKYYAEPGEAEWGC